MVILGINAFHADSSACLVVDGKVIIAIEEERLKRVKHWAGFPVLSIQKCLEFGNMDISSVDKIAVNRDPKAHKSEKIIYTLKNRPKLSNILSRLKNRKEIGDIPSLLADNFFVDKAIIDKKLVFIEHHLAHMYSAFLTSDFESSVVLSIDGFGDFLSTMWGIGSGSEIKVDNYVAFPHSLGLLYQSITQFLGFWNYGDEYKVMGMAAYGHPNFMKEMRELISIEEDGKFKLNTEFFRHPDEGISMEFDDGYPKIGPVFTEKMEKLLGEKRAKDDPINQRHKDIAHSLQVRYEEVLFHILVHLNKLYPNISNLCLSGGCAQNSLANGKISNRTDFKEIWIQPAAGDAGGALGAALAVSYNHYNQKRSKMVSASLGLKYTNNQISQLLEGIDTSSFDLLFEKDEEKLVDLIVELLIKGKVIGFFHGPFEWGPRALGNRSIIVDPRLDNMKTLLNEKIKKREGFRPFAPSVMKEKAFEWFEKNEDVPFMTHVFKIKPEKRKLIPAVTHEDGTGRIQTVTKEFNSRYYDIIKKFDEITSVPMILNTSFNENEPIVNSPEEALNCFLRTKMDVVVLENYVLKR